MSDIIDSVVVGGITFPLTTDTYKHKGFTRVTFQTVINGVPRHLKSEYRQELVDDLRELHGLDMDEEIQNILRAEITAEVEKYVESL